MAFVDDIMVAIAFGRGAHPDHIPASAQFGHGEAADDSAHYALTQISVLLSL